MIGREQKCELKYLREFAARNELFSEELARNQLRALWTAYCLHNNLDVDTAGYDVALMGLWTLIDEHAGPDLEKAGWTCYDEFDSFMAELLV